MNDRDFVYSFTCRLCGLGWKHASDIQDHLMEKHGIPLEETHQSQYIKAEKVPL